MRCKRFIIFGIFALFVSSAFASPAKTIPIKKNDLNTAKYLNNIHKQLNRISLRHRTIKNGYLYAKKSKIFDIYHHLFQKLEIIAKKNINTKTLIQTCNHISEIPRSQERPIFNSTLDLSDHFCVGKYLKYKSNKKIRFLSDLEKNFFKKNLGPLLAGRHKKSFVAFLDRIKDHSPAQIFISKIITSFYINLNESPDKKIISHIIIDEKLTSYIQLKELVDKSTLKFFKKEFRILYKRALKNIKKEEKNSKIKKSINYIVSFYDTNKNYISAEVAMTYFKAILKNLISKKQLNLAIDFSQVIMKNIPSDFENEAIFLRIWTLLRTNNNKKASNIIKEKKLVQNFDDLDSRLRYWVAKTFKKANEWTQAKDLFYKQIRRSPINYYSILSFKELQKLSKNINARELFMFNNTFSNKNQEYQDEIYENMISRLEIWIRLHNNNFINKEIEFFLKKEQERFKDIRQLASSPSDNNEKNLTFKLISYLNKKKKHLEIFNIINDSIDQNIIHINEKILHFLFPDQYMSAIKNIDNIIDPLIVLSLIRQESAFNPKAKSIVGARGLMQLMPQNSKKVQYKNQAPSSQET